MHTTTGLFLALSITSVATAQTPDTLQWWPKPGRPAQHAFEAALNAIPAPASLKAYHERFASEPHIAGTEGDLRNIERLVESFVDLGLEVQVHEFWAYLAYPVDAAVEIVGAGEGGTALSLSVRERDLPEDPFDNAEGLTIGWNAYSGSGDITGEIVYANYGTKADFDALKSRGVNVKDKIVLARYGGNFRGYKAKFAEAAGAAGLIIYTDPGDSGFVKGEVYPEGGWANESYIQRGSIKALDYPGDPLTPFEPSTEDAVRLREENVALPHIPVQPIGYGAAKEILSRMQGDALPADLAESWQGGFDFPYRLTGGADLSVRLMVQQKRELTRTANVLATIEGALYPDEKVMIGCHHDAWCHGAGDPQAGTMLLYEAAKSFAALVADGHRPARSIVFANWGAEEYGIIGSTEYVEQYATELAENTIAYINLDAATMGPNFRSSAAPTLKTLIETVIRLVPAAPSAKTPEGSSVYDAWRGESEAPTFGNLGGGSDHIGFYCYLCIPSCGVNAGGAPGSAYHSNYDNIAWYQKVVGDDYQPALMLTRIVNLVAARLANAPVLPLDPSRYAPDMKTHLGAISKRAGELGFEMEFVQVQRDLNALESQAREIIERLLAACEADLMTTDRCARVNDVLRSMEKQWQRTAGLADRPWFRNLFAATDPDSGYASWMLPAFRRAVEDRDAVAFGQAAAWYEEAIGNVAARIRDLAAIIPQVPTD